MNAPGAGFSPLPAPGDINPAAAPGAPPSPVAAAAGQSPPSRAPGERRPGGGIHKRPVILVVYCGAGGACFGYYRAGFNVVGVDNRPQPNYPFTFIQADAIEVLDRLLAGAAVAGYRLADFAAVSGSPPCQDHSETSILHTAHGTAWLLGATRERFTRTGLPWVLENVQGSGLARQDDLFGARGLTLCGCMFPELRGLLYEDRLFETSFGVPQPSHVKHVWPQTKMGRPPKPGECMQVTGHFSDAAEARRRMRAEWMSRDELAQAIPPAFTKHIGRQLLRHLRTRAAVA